MENITLLDFKMTLIMDKKLLLICLIIGLFSYQLQAQCDGCTEWTDDGPDIPAGPFGLTQFGDLPCGPDCDGIVIEPEWDVWPNESYYVPEVFPGTELTFSFCDGYDEDQWPAEITIIDGEGLQPNEATGDVIACVEDCEITFTIPDGVNSFVIVIHSLFTFCGSPPQDSPNGYVTLTCNGGGVCTDGCYAGDVYLGLANNAQTYCPGESIFLETDNNENFLAGYEYAWIFTNTDGSGTGDVIVQGLGTDYEGDINTYLENNGLAPLPSGNTFDVTGAFVNEDGELDPSCTNTENAITITISDGTDDACADPCLDGAPENNECDGGIPLALGYNGPFNNECASSEASDPTTGFDCFFEDLFGEEPFLNNTLWFTLTGDGETYFVHTSRYCSLTGPLGASYINNGDTQMAIYSGSCGNLEPVACNEDDFDLISVEEGNVAGITFETEVGVEYYIMVDGFNDNDGTADGEYCVFLEQSAIYECTIGDAITAIPPDSATGSGTTDDPYVFCANEIVELNVSGELVGDPEAEDPTYIWLIYTDQPQTTDPLDFDSFWTFQVMPDDQGGALLGSGNALGSTAGIVGTYVMVPVILPSPVEQFDSECTGIIVGYEYPVITFIDSESEECLTAPINNTCDEPYSLGSTASYLGPFNNFLADADDAPTTPIDCFSNDDDYQASVWFAIEGTGNIITISTNGCDGTVTDLLDDTQMALYDDCDGELVDCNDDIETGVNNYSSITFPSEMGTTYYLLVDSYEGAEGNFCFDVLEEEVIIPDNNLCSDSENLELPTDFTPVSNGPYNNTFATIDETDPTDGFECFGDEVLNYPLWFKIEGDGETYDIITNDCGGGLDNYIEDGDTQIAIYTGECGDLTPLDCNEDIIAGPTYPAGLTLETSAGTDYYIMIDGYVNGDFNSIGEYCVEIRKVCSANVGTITPPSNTIACEGSNMELLSIDGNADGNYLTLFLITTAPDLTIVDITDDGSISFDALDLEYGDYTVHALNYHSDDSGEVLGAASVGNSAAEVVALIDAGTICADLDATGITYTYQDGTLPPCNCSADYGTVDAPGNTGICSNYTSLSEPITLEGDASGDFTSIFVITEGPELTIVGTNPPGEIDFSGFDYGDYNVHAFNYYDEDEEAILAAIDGGATAAVVAELIINGTICAELDTEGITFTVTSCGSNTNITNNSNMVLYPVPASDQLMLDLQLEKAGEGVLEVYDISGQLLLQQNVQFNDGLNQLPINIEKLKAGLYNLQINLDQFSISNQFIKH